MQSCSVCEEDALQPFAELDNVRYWRCRSCQATLLDPAHFLPREAEHRHYLSHDNRIDDPRYRAFLSRLAEPLLERLQRPSRVLDYGCGPGPALAAMLREASHDVSVYDPFFAPDRAVLEARYDAIASTETVEHFHAPAVEFRKLRSLLAEGGLLAIMTCFQTNDSRFADWHYRKDPTHVVFYKSATFEHLARRWSMTCTIPAKDIVILEAGTDIL